MKTTSSGFTLLEALVALLLLSVIIVAFLAMLETFSGMVQIQGNIADTTENMRYTMAALIRLVRMTGTGGIPVACLDGTGNLAPIAIDVADNITSGVTFTSCLTGTGFGVTANRAAIANTDVLRLRGVITTPIYDIIVSDFQDADTVHIPEISPWTGALQELLPPDSSNGRAFLVGLQMPLDINAMGGRREYGGFRIVQATNDTAVTTGGGGDYLPIDFNDTSAGGYAALNPSGDTTVIAAQAYSGGFVDDFIFFVAPNAFGEPSLYRLRVSNSAGGPFVAEELVPNVSNFQVSLGCDIDVDGDVEGAEWFLSEDNPAAPTATQLAGLREVRMSVVSRTQDPDRGWTASPDMPENAPDISGAELRFRYRPITVRVALRSHPQLRR